MKLAEKEKPNPVSWTQKLTSKLIEVVKTGILLTDKEGKILFANRLASDFLGYQKNLLRGKNISTLFLPEDEDIFLPNIMRLAVKSSGFHGEALLRRKNNTTFFVNLSTALYTGNRTDRELIIFAIQDITHIKEMEKEYLDSERFAGLGMITEQISHQIRNPIVSIGGFALRLARDDISIEEYGHYGRLIHGEAQRLERIISRLSEFVRTHPPTYAPFPVSAIFGEIEKTFTDDGNAWPKGLVFPDADKLPQDIMFGDLTLLTGALHSVIQNGLEAVHDTGTVGVVAEVTHDKVTIIVSDNGPGISDDDIPYIFDPFFTTKFACLGLGLTMARKIIQEHKGKIEAQSAPGRGAEFHITLPRERRREIRSRIISP